MSSLAHNSILSQLHPLIRYDQVLHQPIVLEMLVYKLVALTSLNLW